MAETEAAPAAGDEEEEGVSLCIPACEMLDLAVMTEPVSDNVTSHSDSPTERSYLGHNSPARTVASASVTLCQG